MKAATEVLPLVPVTAAMVPGWRGKNVAAARGERTARIGDLHEGDGVGQSVRALFGGDRHAPAATACFAKCAPSALAPAMATNRKPALTLRLSAAMPASSSAAKRGSKRAFSSGRSASFIDVFLDAR